MKPKIRRTRSRMLKSSLLLPLTKKMVPEVRRIVELGYEGNVEKIRPLIEKMADKNADIRYVATISIAELIGVDKKKAQKILFLYGFNHRNPVVANRIKEIYELYFPPLLK